MICVWFVSIIRSLLINKLLIHIIAINFFIWAIVVFLEAFNMYSTHQGAEPESQANFPGRKEGSGKRCKSDPKE